MPGILEQFGVDWRLILAQVSTFLIFLWLLNRFVFGKFLSLLEERQKRIRKGLELTEKMEQELGRLGQLREQTLEQIGKEGEKIVLKAKQDAELRTKTLLSQARQKAEKEFERAKTDIVREKEAAIKEVKEEIADLTISATERVLSRAITQKDKKRFRKEAVEALSREYANKQS